MVEEYRVDREPHEEHVDRRGRLEQDAFPARKLPAPEQAAHPQQRIPGVHAPFTDGSAVLRGDLHVVPRAVHAANAGFQRAFLYSLFWRIERDPQSITVSGHRMRSNRSSVTAEGGTTSA